MIPDLVAGVFDGLRGAVYLVTHPRLWKYVLAPALVAALLLVVVISSTLGLLSGPIAAVAAFLPGTWADNVLELVAGIVLTVFSLAIFVSVAALIAGPFNEMLSEAIEERETGVAGPRFTVLGFLRDVIVGVLHAARRVSVYLVVILALLVLGIVVPVVGSVIATVLGAIATARFASYDAYDAVWSRRRLRYREKIEHMRARRWRTLGLGAVVGALAIVPGLSVVGLAIGATAATLRSLAEAGGATRSGRADRAPGTASAPAAP